MEQVSRRRFLKQAAAIGAVGLAGVLGVERGFGAATPMPTAPITRPSNSISTASYILYPYKSSFFAQNGNTGQIDFSGTDATTVIQGAINALENGGELFLRNGTYTVGSTIKIPSNVTLQGEGRRTIVRVGDGMNIEAFKCIDGSSGIILKDFNIDGNPEGQKYLIGAMINLSNGANNLVENMVIDGSADSGIWVASTTDTSIINCRVTNCVNAGLGIRGPLVRRVNVIGGQYISNTVGVQVINDCQFVSIVGTIAEDNGTFGQYGSGIEWTTLIGSISPMFGSIVGCICEGNDRGINLESDTTYVTVDGNSCISNLLEGVALNSAQKCSVVGNTCSYNDCGIKVQDLDSWSPSDILTIVGNRCNENTSAAIALLGAGSSNKVAQNIGFNPQGIESVFVGSSPYTYINSDNVPEAIYIDGGVVSAIAKNSAVIFTSTGKMLWLEPGESVTVTYSDPPRINKDRK